MNDDEKLMREAIKAAKEAEANGGVAIGAVMVKDGEVVSRGLSITWENRDPSNHGEMDCVRNYAKEFGMDYSGCTLYGTLEPCSMCLGVCLWSGVERMVFGAYAGDVVGNDYEYNDYSAEEFAKKSRVNANPDNGPVQVTGGVLREECKALLADYDKWQKVN